MQQHGIALKEKEDMIGDLQERLTGETNRVGELERDLLSEKEKIKDCRLALEANVAATKQAINALSAQSILNGD